jgi:hypothetical protein
MKNKNHPEWGDFFVWGKGLAWGKSVTLRHG